MHSFKLHQTAGANFWVRECEIYAPVAKPHLWIVPQMLYITLPHFQPIISKWEANFQKLSTQIREFVVYSRIRSTRQFVAYIFPRLFPNIVPHSRTFILHVVLRPPGFHDWAFSNINASRVTRSSPIWSKWPHHLSRIFRSWECRDVPRSAAARTAEASWSGPAPR